MKNCIIIGLILLLVFSFGCSTTQKGALGGAAVGAGAGAIIGHNTHHGSGKGALVGSLIGGLVGALAGDAYETQQENERFRRENAVHNYSVGYWASYQDMWD